MRSCDSITSVAESGTCAWNSEFGTECYIYDDGHDLCLDTFLSSTELTSRELFLFPVESVVPSVLCLQCFDAVGWAAGRPSGL